MANQIAQIIWSQLNSCKQDIFKVMSWGTNTLVAGENFLQFKVQGLKFKGTVRVVYEPVPDVYRVEFYKPRTTEPCKVIEMVYFDELNEKIDLYVEYSGNDEKYKNDLMNDELKNSGQLN
jgi:hypothetical protein